MLVNALSLAGHTVLFLLAGAIFVYGYVLGLADFDRIGVPVIAQNGRLVSIGVMIVGAGVGVDNFLLAVNSRPFRLKGWLVVICSALTCALIAGIALMTIFNCQPSMLNEYPDCVQYGRPVLGIPMSHPCNQDFCYGRLGF